MVVVVVAAIKDIGLSKFLISQMETWFYNHNMNKAVIMTNMRQNNTKERRENMKIVFRLFQATSTSRHLLTKQTTKK